MNREEKHTPEPWSRDDLRIHGAESPGDTVNNTICIVAGNITTLSEDHTNAARIVACVNALAGVEKPEQAIGHARSAIAILGFCAKAERMPTLDELAAIRGYLEGLAP